MGKGNVFVNGHMQEFSFAKTETPDGLFLFCKISGHGFQKFIEREDHHAKGSANKANEISAPVPRKVVKVLVSNGESIDQKQTVVILESMKMEFEVQAMRDAIIEEVVVEPGSQVNADDLLIKLQEEDD